MIHAQFTAKVGQCIAVGRRLDGSMELIDHFDPNDSVIQEENLDKMLLRGYTFIKVVDADAKMVRFCGDPDTQKDLPPGRQEHHGYP